MAGCGREDCARCRCWGVGDGGSHGDCEERGGAERRGAIATQSGWKSFDYAPPPGTPLLVSLARGGAEHSGVFLGRSRVAELRGDGNICNASLSDFINGDADDPMNVRSGTRIFAACDDKTGMPLSSANVVAAARRFIKNVKKVSYNLFCNNCHVFTASCVEGNMEREQSFLDWVRDGTFSIDRLDEIISKVMNSGRNIAWIGVRGSTRGFIYNLTEEKIDRLESEGRSLWA